jgi:hypothetical protein
MKQIIKYIAWPFFFSPAKIRFWKLSSIFIGFSVQIYHCLAQNQDSTKNQIAINGTMSITNNGFSFIPAFTLDEPAGQAIITIEKNRWSFQNQTQYALNGRPWSITFITRYKVIDKSKATLTAGVHFPATTFFESIVSQNGVEKKLLQSQQSITPEVNVTFLVSKHLKIGAIYLYNRSMDGVPPWNGHYGGTWVALFDLKITKSIRFAIDTQLFYLNLDGSDGTYSFWNFTLSRKGLPFSLSSQMYKTISSNIDGKDTNWNLSLNYRFENKY